MEVVREAVFRQNAWGLSDKTPGVCTMFCGARSGARRCADKTSGVAKQEVAVEVEAGSPRIPAVLRGRGSLQFSVDSKTILSSIGFKQLNIVTLAIGVRGTAGNGILPLILLVCGGHKSAGSASARHVRSAPFPHSQRTAPAMSTSAQSPPRALPPPDTQHPTPAPCLHHARSQLTA